MQWLRWEAKVKVGRKEPGAEFQSELAREESRQNGVIMEPTTDYGNQPAEKTGLGAFL